MTEKLAGKAGMQEPSLPVVTRGAVLQREQK
jgi:hypothetical protein